MKLKIDVPIIDLMSADKKPEQIQPYGDATLRRVIVYCGSIPCPEPDGRPEPPESSAQAFSIASRAANVPVGGELELNVQEASFIKTRAYRLMFPKFAGPLDAAIEAAAATENVQA